MNYNKNIGGNYMSDYVICLDKYNNVICWGDMFMCKKYVNQLYSISLDEVVYEQYSIHGRYSCYYEDYEVFSIEGTGVYLTLGEIDMIRGGCAEETKSIKYIQEELEYLSSLTNIYNNSIIEELLYMKDFMKELYDLHSRHNADTVFTNLDIDALHSSYQMERENKGLPVVFMQ
jgi:hypothetical protein